MNWGAKYFKNIFFTWIDAGTIVLVLGSFIISHHLNPFLTAETWGENQFKISLIVVLITASNLLLYKKLIPKYTGNPQYKSWQLLSFALDTTFWVLLLCGFIFPIIDFNVLVKFGLLFLAFNALFFIGWVILIKSYHQKYSLNQRFKMNDLAAPIHLAPLYQQQTVLITGAAGTVGSVLAHQLAVISKGTLLLLDQSESGLHHLINSLPQTEARLIPVLADIRSTEQMLQLFKQYQPTMVFHAAAYKQLPILEDFPAEAVLTNIVGTKNLVDAAIETQVQQFIFISTDKAVNPTSVLGITKKIAAAYVTLKFKNSQTQWAVVRFGNVWNSNGSVLPLWEQQLNKSNAIEVRNLQASRYFISESRVAHLLLEIGAFSDLNQHYLLSMGQPIFIKELARQFIKSKQWAFLSTIQLKYTSLLTGEKLHETLIAEEDKLKESKHLQIKIIVPSISENSIDEYQLESLLQSFLSMDTTTLKKVLQSSIY